MRGRETGENKILTLMHYKRSPTSPNLPLSRKGRGGHEDQLAEAFVGHAAEDALVQPGGLVGGGHDGGQLGIVAIVDQLVELLARPGGG